MIVNQPFASEIDELRRGVQRHYVKTNTDATVETSGFSVVLSAAAMINDQQVKAIVLNKVGASIIEQINHRAIDDYAVKIENFRGTQTADPLSKHEELRAYGKAVRVLADAYVEQCIDCFKDTDAKQKQQIKQGVEEAVAQISKGVSNIHGMDVKHFFFGYQEAPKKADALRPEKGVRAAEVSATLGL